MITLLYFFFRTDSILDCGIRAFRKQKGCNFPPLTQCLMCYALLSPKIHALQRYFKISFTQSQSREGKGTLKALTNCCFYATLLQLQSKIVEYLEISLFFKLIIQSPAISHFGTNFKQCVMSTQEWSKRQFFFGTTCQVKTLVML